MKLKKKVFASLLAVSVMLFGTTAMAAPSATVSVADDVKAIVEVSEGFTVEAVEDEIVEDAVVAAAEILEDDTTAEVVSVVDISVKDATKLDNGNYEITVEIPAIAANETVIVLHFTDGEWEKIIPTSVENGLVTFETSSCSPFAFVTVASVASPKTGEAASVAGVVLVASLAAAVVCGKKYFA